MKLGLGIGLAAPRRVGSGGAAPPEPMRLLALDQVRDDVNGVLGRTIAALTLAAGETIVLGFCQNGSDPLSIAPTWNGNALTRRANRAGALQTEVWTYYSAGGGTGDLVIDAELEFPSYFATVVGAALQLTSSPADRSATGSGTSASPLTAATLTTQQADELLVGAVGVNGPETHTAGTWSAGYTRLGRVGNDNTANGGTIDLAYRLVAATATYTAGKTGMTSAPWTACVATLRRA